MIVAVAFRCVRAQSVTVSGIVFCPYRETRFLLSRLGAGVQKPFYRRAVEKWRSGRDWIKQHFDFVDTSPPSLEFPFFALKRYFAFARVGNVAASSDGFIVGFDVFVGPGEYALPVNDRDRPHSSSRAIHGFAHVAHYPAFNNEITHGQGCAMTGNAVVCLVEKPNDLLGDGWRVRSDGIFEVVPKHEVGAMLLVEPNVYRREGCVGFDRDAVVRDEVRNPLMRGLVFRSRLLWSCPKPSIKRLLACNARRRSCRIHLDAAPHFWEPRTRPCLHPRPVHVDAQHIEGAQSIQLNHSAANVGVADAVESAITRRIRRTTIRERTQIRNSFIFYAFAGMPRRSYPPTADVPIFACLSGATGVMCCFGFLLYWLMQPTVLPSKELVQVPLRPAAFVLAPPSSKEDRGVEQGLAPVTMITAAIPEPKPEPSRAKSVKPRQVAKVKKQDRTTPPEPRHTWAYANPHGNVPFFGGLFR